MVSFIFRLDPDSMCGWIGSREGDFFSSLLPDTVWVVDGLDFICVGLWLDSFVFRLDPDSVCGWIGSRGGGFLLLSSPRYGVGCGWIRFQFCRVVGGFIHF